MNKVLPESDMQPHFFPAKKGQLRPAADWPDWAIIRFSLLQSEGAIRRRTFCF
jgi:hypothetical protein